MKFSTEQMDIQKLLRLIPSNIWDLVGRVRMRIIETRDQGGPKLSMVQTLAVGAVFGYITGEDETIDRMKWLESRVSYLEDRNNELENLLVDANKKAPLQGVKMEE